MGNKNGFLSCRATFRHFAIVDLLKCDADMFVEKCVAVDSQKTIWSVENEMRLEVA